MDEARSALVKTVGSKLPLVLSLEAEVKSERVQVKTLKNRVQVTMADEILFPEGEWEVGPHGIEVPNKVSHPCRASTGSG
jgi:hypothetical protein